MEEMWVPLAGKLIPTSKNKFCVLKNWFPLILVMIFVNRKKLYSKVDGLHQRENPSPIAVWRIHSKTNVPLDGTKLSLSRVSEKIFKNGFQQPENPFSLPVMKHLLKNTFPLHAKTASSGKKMEESGFFEQNSFPLILTMVFNSRKKALNKSILNPLDRK